MQALRCCDNDRLLRLTMHHDDFMLGLIHTLM